MSRGLMFLTLLFFAPAALPLAASEADAVPDTTNDELIRRVTALASDPDAGVRMQAAFTIGVLPAQLRIEPLARIAARDFDNEWTRKAVLTSVGPSGPELFLAVAETESAAPFLQELAALIGSRERGDEITRFINALPSQADMVRIIGLGGLKQGLEVAGAKKLDLRAAAEGLNTLAAVDGRTGELARALAPVILGDAAASVVGEASKARAVVYSGSASSEELLAALRSFTPKEEDVEKLSLLLHPRESAEIQLLALGLLDKLDSLDVGPVVVAAFQGLDPLARGRALELLYARKPRVHALLAALEDQRIRSGWLDSSWRTRLLNHPDPDVRKRVATFFTETAGTFDQRVFEQYRPALEMQGDPVKGALIHQARCAQCHRVGTVGFDVGPAWAGVRSNPPEKILSAILYPNQSIAAGFTDFVIELNDGETTTGLIVASSPAGITLRRAGGEEEIILRRNIKSMRDTAFSLMPENIYDGLSTTDMADLLAFVMKGE